MQTSELLRRRLRNQQITRPAGVQPADVVRTLVALQAQEFAMAKWAIALRMARATSDTEVSAAFDSGRILRTHLLRPTWHFVAPEDIRALLLLTAPRVHALNAYQYRQLDLGAAVFKRSDAVVTRALRDEGFLTRTALQAALAKSRVKAAGPRLGYLMMHAELEGLICSGPRQGRQFTYALIEQRVPAAPAMTREAALAHFSRRYFATRGPATAQDFATWSGLTLKDARAGIDSLGADFTQEIIDGQTCVYEKGKAPRPSGCFAFLMPDYDEYGMSYKDRRALMPSQPVKLAYNRMIAVDGRIVGSWRRTAGKRATVETQIAVPLSREQARQVELAVQRFIAFGAEPD